jgi:hypothetical protein
LEQEILEFMLSSDFAGVALLRAQIPHSQVVAVWVDGLPSVGLAVPAVIGKAPIEDGEIPAGSEVRDKTGEYLGEVLVWVVGGYLAAIEYAWVTEEAPTRFPEVANMILV